MNDQVQRTRLRLSELDRQQQYYFYERLRNPKAFDVLAQAGAFNEVTPPEVVEGRVLHFVWPPTLYLRNVVRAIPEQVADLISRIDTQNERVTYDLVDLVRQIPAALQGRVWSTSLFNGSIVRRSIISGLIMSRL